jgi:hypothetical protein
VTHLFEGNFPAAGYTRLPWYRTPALHAALLGLCVPAFLISPLAWWVGTRRHPRGGHRFARRARLAAGALCFVNLLFLTGMLVVIARGHELLFGITPLARAVLVLPLVSAGLTALALVLGVIAFQRCDWGLMSGLHFVLVVGLGLGFLAALGYWNLFGFWT